jgi:hypothetical protein
MAAPIIDAGSKNPFASSRLCVTSHPCLSVSIRGEFNKTLELSRFARRVDGHWSGKGAALPPLPPLRTGRESFPSSGSSRNKAPREQSR